MKKPTAAQKKQLLALSEAMIKGAKKHPQAFGDLFAVDSAKHGDKIVASCALGAAYEGTFGPAVTHEEIDGETVTLAVPEDVGYKALTKKYPVLEKLEVTHPSSEYDEPWELEDTIIDLNDGRTWKRSKIAKWIRSLAE